jgi:hypothetical protein
MQQKRTKGTMQNLKETINYAKFIGQKPGNYFAFFI